jgi:hypothetical protein
VATTLQNTVDWSLGFLGYSTPTVGPANEPAISSANMVQQVMTSPPFRWAWNRSSLTFVTVIGTQDYTVSVSDFGYAEKATFQFASGKIMELEILNSTPLGESSDQQQPMKLAVQLNTVGTSVKFRFLGVPNAIYTVIVWYQKFPPTLTALTGGGGTWLPPDYMKYIYNRGFLAYCLEGMGSPTSQQEKVSFAAALLATAEGLTDTEKNIFLAQYLVNPRTMESLQLKTQQGVQARGQ